MKHKPTRDSWTSRVSTTKDLPLVDYSFIGMNAEEYLMYLRGGVQYKRKLKKKGEKEIEED